MDQYIGRLLDNRYEILEIIGTGGMAVVYKARCHRLNRLVAIKILKDEYARDEEFLRRFQHEGEAVAMLSNPNIVQVYDVSSSNHANFIVMELIDGITLKQYMEKKGTLNWKETLHFSIQIAKALEHAHSRNIIHRDIKPHNIMVLKNGSVKVMDFGIARVMSKSNTLTKEALGSVHYISPEQAKGGWVDNRSDLYSLSVVMYEMMTGRPPYDGESPVAVAIQHINGGAAMPSTLNPNIPGGLEQIIMKGMALEANDRYASATDMLKDLDEFRRDPSILFGTQKTPMNGATQVIQTQAVLEAVRQPRTTAERVAGTASGTGARSKTPGAQSQRTAASGGTPRRESASRLPSGRKTRDEIREEIREEERSRAATIAVVACSAVAILALIIFLVALMNGAFFRDEALVVVPDYVGEYYEKIAHHEFLRVELLKFEYSEEIEQGKVISQQPDGGEKVAKDTQVKLVVSAGPEPVIKTLETLAGQKLEYAEAYLKALGMVPLVREEFSEEYQEGLVVRTDPEAGTLLKDGQTVIIYISKGSMIETKAVPGVTGFDVAIAQKMLNDYGFFNIDIERVEDDAKEGTVIDQSVKKGEEWDLTAEIVLTVSKGPKPTEPPTEPPTEAPTQAPTFPPAPEEVTVTVPLELPMDRTEDYLLGLYQGGIQVLEETIIKAGTPSVEVELTGSGTQSYDLYINNAFYKTVKVEFTVDG